MTWKFSPSNYFEEEKEISHSDYTMTISDGVVQAKIDFTTYEANPYMRQKLNDYLNDRLLGVELQTHRAYNMSKSMITRVYPDGHTDLLIEPDTGELVCSVGTPDTHDFKRRIDKGERLGKLITAGITTQICNHSWRATGITTFLENGGAIGLPM